MNLSHCRLAAAILCLAVMATAAMAADEGGALVLFAKAVPAGITTQRVLKPDADVWQNAQGFALRLNRTPPLYATGPMDDGKRPSASVRLLRLADGSVAARVQWTDATKDLVPSDSRFPDAGEDHVYKMHSERVDVFGDAACVMVPQQRGPHERYPTMMMGDASDPVHLYFWRAGVGFQTLNAHGRASTQKTENVTPGCAARNADGWTVILTIPDASAGTPICFAIWDGSQQHRDGLKYFSLWYEVQ